MKVMSLLLVGVFISILSTVSFAQQPPCSDIGLKVEGYQLNQSDCVVDCNQYVAPVFFKYLGTGSFTTFAANEPQAYIEILSGDVKIVGICKDFYDNSSTPQLLDISIINNGQAAFFSESGTYHFDFTTQATPHFSLILESTGTEPEGDFDIGITQFHFYVPSGGGYVECDDVVQLHTLLPWNEYDACDNPGLSIEFGTASVIGQEATVPVKLNIPGGGSVDVTDMNIRIQVDKNNAGSVVEVEPDSWDEDFANLIPDKSLIGGDLFIYTTSSTAVTLNDDDVLFNILVTAPSNPNEGVEVDFTAEFVTAITDNDGCCEGTGGAVGEATVPGLLPCEVQDYQVLITGPEEVVEGCLMKYTVSLDYTGSLPPAIIKFEEIKLDLGLDMSGSPNVYFDIPNSNSYFDCFGSDCGSFQNGVISYHNVNDTDWDSDDFDIIGLFDFYVNATTGTLNKITYINAEADIWGRHDPLQDPPLQFDSDEIQCVPVALDNQTQQSFAGVFQLKMRLKESDDCKAIYTAFLEYTGSNDDEITFEDVDIDLSATGDDLVIEKITPLNSLCMTSCWDINGTTITLHPDQLTFDYSDQNDELDLIDIMISSETSGCIDGVSYGTSVWKLSGLGFEICAPGKTGFTGEICLDDVIVTGSISLAECDETGLEGAEICFTTDCPDFGKNCLSVGNCALTATTDSEGDFVSANTCAARNESSGDLKAFPCIDDCESYRSCLSTLDIVKVSKHILHVAYLDSPYKMLAADANCTGTITTLDVVAIRKVILFLEDGFPNCDCWKFIPSDFDFPNPSNPWSTAIPTCINVNEELEDIDFVAVKTGDVNCTCSDDLVNPPLALVAPNYTNIDENDVIEVNFKPSNFSSYMAYQLGIGFNPDYLEYVQIEEKDIDGISAADNFGLTELASGEITTLWYDDEGAATSLESTEAMFSIKFKALQSIAALSSSHIWLDNDILPNRAWKPNEEAHAVTLSFGSGGFGKVVLDNTGQPSQIANNSIQVSAVPNPFKDKTTLEIDIPEASSVSIELFDAVGTRLMAIEKEMDKGRNTLILEDVTRLPEGVYHYVVKTNDNSVTGKIMKSY